MTPVRLDQVSKHFGDAVALDRVSLSIDAGELFFLLGPSGCGKSTLLRLIAGLHEPTAGRLFFGDRDVTGLSTEKRNAVMCFQSYALWPHMSVRDNVRFGLDVRRVPKAEQKGRLDRVLDLVRMGEYADRRPNQLSGGQQQRVALARAIAVEPAVLLLDEPLSNLDAKLRNEMRSEIRRICKQSGLTAVYVTHDQKEALSVADRIAVLDRGRVAQVGTPGDLYGRPMTAFVADFVGQTNLIDGELLRNDAGHCLVRTALGDLQAVAHGDLPGGHVTLSVRPEQMRLAAFDSMTKANRLQAIVRDTTFLGEASEHALLTASHGPDGARTTAYKVIAAPPRFDLHKDAPVAVEFDATDAVVLPRA